MSMLDTVGRDPSDFRPVVRAIRRWFGLLVLASVVGALGGFAVSKVLPPEYESTVRLYLTASNGQTGTPQDAQSLAATYVQLAGSDVVLGPAMDAVHSTGLTSFRDHTRIAQVRDTSLIGISFRDRDPQRAADAANAIAEAFIQQNRQLQSALRAAASDGLGGRVTSLSTELATLDNQIATLRSSIATLGPSQTDKRTEEQARLLQLEAEREAKRQGLADLAVSAEQVRVAGGRDQGNLSLWQPAVPPSETVGPRVGLNTLLGALAAGLIGLLVVGIIGYRDDRILDPEDMLARFQITPLGDIKRVSAREKIGTSLFVRDDPRSAVAESFRSLRTNIWFASANHSPPRVILVTSPEAREGKSLISANLAFAFAQAGVPTILVDADLRQPTQHRLFNLNGGVGLTQLIAGKQPLETLDKFRVDERLFVVPSGPLPTNPAEVASSDGMADVLQHLGRMIEGSVVVVDSSPLLSITDAIALSPSADACLLVVDASRTSARSVRRAIASLRMAQAVLMGAVLNNLERVERRQPGGPSSIAAHVRETGRSAERSERATST